MSPASEASASYRTTSITLRDYISEHGLPIKRGIEKEGLRAAPSSQISQSDHPSALGHPLTHPSITTDYSEALLELITGVEDSRESLMAALDDIHRYVLANIGDEVLWAGSMPCTLNGEESIRIGEYGDSNIGRLKHVYRQGLGVRYGRIMQSIAGLHFNFSYDDAFWAALQKQQGKTNLSLQDFKSEQYFCLIRNFRRYAWLLMYLFGASPCLDQSFIESRRHQLMPLDDKGSLYLPYATSLRMGDLGYHNNAQSSLAICFNKLDNFIHTLGSAIHTSYPAYEDIGLKRGDDYIQINTNILQIENEYYSSIRPKRSAKSGETPRHALSERGVEYIEVRCLDLNPFFANGISAQQIDFLDIFLTHCLCTDSPIISDEECKIIDSNFNTVVNRGREPGLQLITPEGEASLSTWAQSLLNNMAETAKTLDTGVGDGRYQSAIKEQINKVTAPELTPSAQVLDVMKRENLSWIEFALTLSQKHKTQLTGPTAKIDKNTRHFKQLAEESFINAQTIKAQDTISFDDFIEAYQAQ